jgi:hypothetical protein
MRILPVLAALTLGGAVARPDDSRRSGVRLSRSLSITWTAGVTPSSSSCDE